MINCGCGVVARGETDDELVANAEQHIDHDHPQEVGTLTREDLLDMAEEAYYRGGLLARRDWRNALGRIDRRIAGLVRN